MRRPRPVPAGSWSGLVELGLLAPTDGGAAMRANTLRSAADEEADVRERLADLGHID